MEQLKYSIQIEEYENQKIVHTTIEGLMSAEERDDIAIETSKFMKDNRINKLIWDIRKVKLKYSLIGSHAAIMKLKYLGLESDMSVAVIYFYDAEQHEHAQTVAINRGITNIKYFKSFDEGLEWLLNRD